MGKAVVVVARVAASTAQVEGHRRQSGSTMPGHHGLETTTGGGLHLLDSLTSRWGTELSAHAESLWCEINALADARHVARDVPRPDLSSGPDLEDFDAETPELRSARPPVRPSARPTVEVRRVEDACERSPGELTVEPTGPRLRPGHSARQPSARPVGAGRGQRRRPRRRRTSAVGRLVHAGRRPGGGGAMRAGGISWAVERPSSREDMPASRAVRRKCSSASTRRTVTPSSRARSTTSRRQRRPATSTKPSRPRNSVNRRHPPPSASSAAAPRNAEEEISSSPMIDSNDSGPTWRTWT